jgi:hypothetical protein
MCVWDKKMQLPYKLIKENRILIRRFVNIILERRRKEGTKMDVFFAKLVFKVF